MITFSQEGAKIKSKHFLEFGSRLHDPVWLDNFLVNTAKCWQTFYDFLQIYHSYYNKQLRVDKLASFTLAYKSLAVFAF